MMTFLDSPKANTFRKENAGSDVAEQKSEPNHKGGIILAGFFKGPGGWGNRENRC